MATQEVRKKLLEVALPLDAINKASVREKPIRHGHPSTVASVVGNSAVGGGAGEEKPKSGVSGWLPNTNGGTAAAGVSCLISGMPITYIRAEAQLR